MLLLMESIPACMNQFRQSRATMQCASTTFPVGRIVMHHKDSRHPQGYARYKRPPPRADGARAEPGVALRLMAWSAKWVFEDDTAIEPSKRVQSPVLALLR